MKALEKYALTMQTVIMFFVSIPVVILVVAVAIPDHMVNEFLFGAIILVSYFIFISQLVLGRSKTAIIFMIIPIFALLIPLLTYIVKYPDYVFLLEQEASGFVILTFYPIITWLIHAKKYEFALLSFYIFSIFEIPLMNLINPGDASLYLWGLTLIVVAVIVIIKVVLYKQRLHLQTKIIKDTYKDFLEDIEIVSDKVVKIHIDDDKEPDEVPANKVITGNYQGNTIEIINHEKLTYRIKINTTFEEKTVISRMHLHKDRFTEEQYKYFKNFMSDLGKNQIMVFYDNTIEINFNKRFNLTSLFNAIILKNRKKLFKFQLSRVLSISKMF